MEEELSEMDAQGKRMRTIGFLGALALLLASMGAVVVEQAYPPRPGSGKASGEIRPVPQALLGSQLRSGRLSDQEADHWRPEPREQRP